MSILFAAGERPLADAIGRAFDADIGGDDWGRARISFRPEPDGGWLELLASGLTFDLSGLAPAAGAEMPDLLQRLALKAGEPAEPIEALSLLPGPHVSAGGALLPVVRVLCGLSARLAQALPARAVCWGPAGTWMAPEYFGRIVSGWLGGGPFPALGLTALAPEADGSVVSTGLSFFTGQELRLEPRPGEAPAETVKLAVRIIDALVRQGPVAAREQLLGPDGERLVLAPEVQGGRITVWRDA